jgi:uncharacterized protein
MTVHGKDHWDRVERNVRMLAAVTPGADLDVCVWFARLHDTMRDNEYRDPAHGPRAAEIAREVWNDADNYNLDALDFQTLGRDQLDLLCDAIDRHDLGEVSDDPTIGVCWDADRLDLPRVGVEPNPALMSTKAGRYLAKGGRE